ncbi:MAG TPA: hypothetical protein VFB92_24500 [Vicinamibacterales bacterium]|nr:hypothetical protein [Vicinamibacterales bacterium]
MALIRLPVDRTLVEERLVYTIEALALLPNDVLQASPLLFNLTLPVFPHVQDDGVEQAHVFGLRSERR